MKKSYIIPETDTLAGSENLMQSTLPISPGQEVDDGYSKEREDASADSEQTEQKDAWSGGLW